MLAEPLISAQPYWDGVSCPANCSTTKAALTSCSFAFIGAFEYQSIVGGSGDHDPQTPSGRLMKLQCFCGVLRVSTKRISEHTEARVESGPDSQVLTAVSIMGQVR